MLPSSAQRRGPACGPPRRGRPVPRSARAGWVTMARYATTVNLTVHERDGAVAEQRDIEIFLTLAEELHFGRTAERLHVSTARVSQSIAKWERRGGGPPLAPAPPPAARPPPPPPPPHRPA